MGGNLGEMGCRTVLLDHFNLLKFAEGFGQSLLAFVELLRKLNCRKLYMCTELHERLGKYGVSYIS